MQDEMLNRFHWMKLSITIIVAIVIAITVYYSPCQPAFAESAAHSIDAPSAILIDAKTGETLWDKAADEKRQIASTTKIITAVLAVERKRIDDTVTVGADAVALSRAGINLRAGEALSLRDLLYALMLNSANDAAVAIADHVSGSVERFAGLMNDKAHEIGVKNTNYINPHGLIKDGEQHFSTARDLATVTRYALKNKTIRNIVQTKEWRLNRADPKLPSTVANRNKLLWSYPGATGVKTGHTDGAAYCLVASANRNGVSLISVVLGSKTQESVFSESSATLDYGFSLYGKKRLIAKRKIYRTVNLKFGQRINAVAASNVDSYIRNSKKTYESIKMNASLMSPIKKGAILGKVTVLQAGKPIASSALVAEQDINKPTFSEIVSYYWDTIFHHIL